MTTLPSGWAYTNIATVAAQRKHAIKAGPFGSALKKEYYVSSGFKIYGQEQVLRGDAKYGDYYISSERYEALRSCAVGPRDILLSLVGTIGRALILPEDFEPGIINPRLVKITLDERVMLAEYFTYLLQSPHIRTTLKHAAHGETMDVLNLTILRGLQLPLPPRPEQDRIVAAIEEQFSRLDAGLAALKRARQNLKRMRAAVLEAAVKGQLLGTAKIAGMNDAASESELPAGWSIAPVRDIAEVSGGITKNPKRVPLNRAIPFLRVANVMRDQLDLREVHKIEVFDGELERFRLQHGDLLVVEGNGSPDQIGRSALWDGSIDPCVHQNHLIRVRPGSRVVPEYLNIFWNAPSSMATIRAAASSTSGLHTLSTGKVRNIEVTFPPLHVQHQIIEEVDRQLSALNDLDEQLGIAEAHARILRAAILSAAFSGNLAAQDPSEDPASVLLEQIAAERTASNGPRLKRGRKPQAPREEVTA